MRVTLCFATRTRLYTYPLINLIYFGSDRYSLLHLEALQQRSSVYKDLNVVHVVTASDRTPVASYCSQVGLNYTIWPKNLPPDSHTIRSLINLIQTFQSSSSSDLSVSSSLSSSLLLGLVISFGRFLPTNLIENFGYGCINLHPSLIPRWKGPSPLIHTLIHNDLITAVTILRIQTNLHKFDTGLILKQKSIELIDKNRINVPIIRDKEQLVQYLSPFSIEVMFDVLLNQHFLKYKGINQSIIGKMFKIQELYAPKPTNEMGYINWNEYSACDIIRLWHAFSNTSVQLTTKLYLNNEIEQNCLKTTNTHFLDHRIDENIEKINYAYVRLIRCPLLVTSADLCEQINGPLDSKTIGILDEAFNQFTNLLPIQPSFGSIFYLRSQFNKNHYLLPYLFVNCKTFNAATRIIQSNTNTSTNKFVNFNDKSGQSCSQWLALSNFLIQWPQSHGIRHLSALEFHNGYLMRNLYRVQFMHQNSFCGFRYFGQFDSFPVNLFTIKPWTQLTPTIEKDIIPDWEQSEQLDQIV